MEPINKQDVLIRLLKDGYISDEEFKALWGDEPKQVMRSGYLRTDSGTPLFPVGQITCGTGGSKIGSKELEKDFKGMRPKTWAFLNDRKSSEFTQLEEGFEDKLQTVQPKKGGGFWVTIENKGV